MSEIRQKAWICSVCGYIHYGPTPPNECPVCEAGASEFTLLPEEELAAASIGALNANTNIVIVGAGIAGVSAAEEIRKTSSEAKILMLSNETSLPYYRLNLTRFLAGQILPDQFAIHPEEWYSANNIDLRLGVEAASIDPKQKKVTLTNGEVFDYDKLLLTTGARPFLPPVSGAQLENVHTLRTRKDAEKILASSKGSKVVCIGGGLLGLETAGALHAQGAQVTVIEALEWLIPRQLNQKASAIFQKIVEKMGIGVFPGAKVKELIGTGKVNSVLLEDGQKIPADLVVFSAGVRANLSLAVQAGLTVNQGIVVDQTMAASVSDIYAAGDVAEFNGMLYGTWSPALAQGITAGLTAIGQTVFFKGLPRSAKLKVLGIDLFSIGKISPLPGDLIIEDVAPNQYLGFVFEDGIISGAILLGDSSGATEVKQAVEDHLNCSELLAKNPDARQVVDYLISQYTKK